jgi:hypothetical protein
MNRIWKEFSNTMIRMAMVRWTTKNLPLFFVEEKVMDHRRIRVSNLIHLNNNTANKLNNLKQIQLNL